MAHLIERFDAGFSITDAGWHNLFGVLPPTTPARSLFERSFARHDGEPGVWRFDDMPVELTLPSGARSISKTHKHLVRNDLHAHIEAIDPPVVTTGYKVIQPEDMYEIAESLAIDGNLVIDTAFSMCNGNRAVLTCRGSSFDIGGSDDINTAYLILANGSDGTLAFHAIPSSVRVVCNNTLRMALRGKSAYTFKHCGDIDLKKEEIKLALTKFNSDRDDFREQATALSRKVWTPDQREDFFASVYESLFEKIPTTPTTEKEKKSLVKAKDILGDWLTRFNYESSLPNMSRGSAWLAANAVTHYLDHKRNHRVNAALKDEARINSNLLGDVATDKVAVMNAALSLV